MFFGYRAGGPRTLPALCLAAFIIRPPCPSDHRDHHGRAVWVVNACNLVLAALVLVAGSMSDRLGREGMLLAGLGVLGAAARQPA
jgi:MFS family permease